MLAVPADGPVSPFSTSGYLAPVPIPTPLKQLARGFAMGSADIVPGVSGGTVALVLGIYERLIANLHSGASAIRHLLQGQVTEFRRRLAEVEWVWLVSLLGGILLAVFALASVLEHLLDTQPVRMAALFFGLVAASVVVAWRLVRRIDLTGLAVMAVTALVLFVLLGSRTSTTATGEEVVTQPLWVFFLVGAIAICAMILPGISGSFILVLLGMYTEVLGAVNSRDLPVLAAFALGCAVGLGLFSTLLNWLLEHHHDRVLAVMIGLMLGSLRVLWPWPGGTNTTELGAPSGDVAVPVLLMVAGFTVVLAVEWVAVRRTRHSEQPAIIPSQ
jgi:putative membrane protein